MPTYEYECKKCLHKFTIIKAMKHSTTSEKCPCCGVIAKRVLSSMPGFILKGTGFYQTDYKDKENG